MTGRCRRGAPVCPQSEDRHAQGTDKFHPNPHLPQPVWVPAQWQKPPSGLGLKWDSNCSHRHSTVQPARSPANPGRSAQQEGPFRVLYCHKKIYITKFKPLCCFSAGIITLKCIIAETPASLSLPTTPWRKALAEGKKTFYSFFIKEVSNPLDLINFS